LGGNQFGYQRKLISLGACCNFAVPQLSARPLGSAIFHPITKIIRDHHEIDKRVSKMLIKENSNYT
jgi:hypothetical protein